MGLKKDIERQLSEMDEADVVDRAWVSDEDVYTTDELIAIFEESDEADVRAFGVRLHNIYDREVGWDGEDD